MTSMICILAVFLLFISFIKSEELLIYIIRYMKISLTLTKLYARFDTAVEVTTSAFKKTKSRSDLL